MGDDPARILRIVYTLVVDGTLSRPAARTPGLDRALLETLARYAERGVDPDVAESAASCLWALRGEAARALLLRMAERSEHERVRERARWCAEELGRR